MERRHLNSRSSNHHDRTKLNCCCIEYKLIASAESKLIWLEERCYRCFGTLDLPDNCESLKPQIDVSNPPKDRNTDRDTTSPIDVKIEKAGNSWYKHSFYVPDAFYGLIIGPKGEKLRKLETVTKTAIKIPNRNIKAGHIVITACHLEGIVSARHRIQLLVETSKNKLRPTHFISIPMIDETIKLNFEKFKSHVLNETGKDRKGVKEIIFQKPEKMHLTLGVLTFLDNDELKAGVEAFQECGKNIIRPIIEKHGPIKIKAQGLGCFNKNPATLSVLYGTVTTENDSLRELADEMVKFFLEKGMMKKEREQVNLHMTLMNSMFAVDRKKPNYKAGEKFDATSIIEVQKDHLFGEIGLSTIHMCSLGGPKTEDGYYEIISKINVTE